MNAFKGDVLLLLLHYIRLSIPAVYFLPGALYSPIFLISLEALYPPRG